MTTDHTDQPDDLGTALDELLRAGRQLEVTLARDLGLKRTDLRAVDTVVHHEGALGPAELGELLGIASASATALVDRLETAGHLHRDRHPGDRRRVNLQATSTARDEVGAALGPLLADLGEVTARLRPEEARTVRRFLDEVTTAMHRFNARPRSRPGG